MSRLWSAQRWFPAMLLLFALQPSALALTTARHASDQTENPAQLLQQADGMASSNLAGFEAILQQLSGESAKLSAQQQLHLRYLQARAKAFRGEFKAAIPLMEAIADQSVNPRLAFRAKGVVIDLLVTQSRYEEAFERVGPLLEQLPGVTDRKARIQALGVASQLYLEAGQYDLSLDYSEKLLGESDTPKSACVGWFYRLNALVRGGHMDTARAQLGNATAVCDKAGDVLVADMFTTVVARFEIEQGKPREAIELLKGSYAEVRQKHFPPALADFDVLLARAYWKTNDPRNARDFALRVITNNKDIGGVYSESTAIAYRILYQIAKNDGDLASTVDYLERYMAADKGYLNDVSAKALAYQIVKQKVLSKKLQIEGLDKENKLLTLQGELDRKVLETSRLYILLLLLVVASIALWAYRIKRSQLRFMRLARRDGLTGIFNRQHFVSEAERHLQYCKKSARDACLVLIDLDHFKVVNDTHGHAVGDRVLKRAVAACQAHLRSTDVFGRLGGEEFGMLLPECELGQVLERVEEMRLAVALVSADQDVSGAPVSASFGVATAARSGYELRQLMSDADEALYRAKREGRNRVSLSGSRRAASGVQ